MAVIEEKIYLRIVYTVGHLDLNFSITETRGMPTHSLTLQEYQEKLLCIKYKPCVGLDKNYMIDLHLKKLKRKFRIVDYQVFDTIPQRLKIKP